MCTVTVLPQGAMAGLGAGATILRVSSNRDELRTRATARPPEVYSIDGHQVMMPIDPAGGGTWIAASDRGLVFTLLNSNPGPAASEARLAAFAGHVPSRGLIVPALASSECVSEALDRASSLDVSRFNPFRLLILDRYQLIECWPDGARLRHRRAFLHGPAMRTSSSLGDSIVQGPRRALFRRFFGSAADPRAAQDAFQDHQWPGREAVSVRMERADARTISRTTIELGREWSRLSYQAVGDDGAITLSIPITHGPGRAARCS